MNDLGDANAQSIMALIFITVTNLILNCWWY